MSANSLSRPVKMIQNIALGEENMLFTTEKCVRAMEDQLQRKMSHCLDIRMGGQKCCTEEPPQPSIEAGYVQLCLRE